MLLSSIKLQQLLLQNIIILISIEHLIAMLVPQPRVLSRTCLLAHVCIAFSCQRLSGFWLAPLSCGFKTQLCFPLTKNRRTTNYIYAMRLMTFRRDLKKRELSKERKEEGNSPWHVPKCPRSFFVFLPFSLFPAGAWLAACFLNYRKKYATSSLRFAVSHAVFFLFPINIFVC